MQDSNMIEEMPYTGYTTGIPNQPQLQMEDTAQFVVSFGFQFVLSRCRFRHRYFSNFLLREAGPSHLHFKKLLRFYYSLALLLTFLNFANFRVKNTIRGSTPPKWCTTPKKNQRRKTTNSTEKSLSSKQYRIQTMQTRAN